jgi:AraC family transcriptional regulator
MSYLEQLEKAIIFIENNLKYDIKVEEVAGIAGYSYYHFHRIFEAVLGETIGNYLRIRRLSCAANELIYTDKRILEIAVEYQFESQEAFNRAFKKLYKVSPGSYRKNRIERIIGSQRPINFTHLKHLQENVSLQPSIVQIDDVMLIGIRGKSSLKKNRLPSLWKELDARIDDIPNKIEMIRGYGICEADPDFDLSEFNESTESGHFIGVAVTSLEKIPRDMYSKILPGGKYAVFTHKGKLSTLELTYQYIWGTWVLCSGCEIDTRDDFEFYINV